MSGVNGEILAISTLHPVLDRMFYDSWKFPKADLPATVLSVVRVPSFEGQHYDPYV